MSNRRSFIKRLALAGTALGILKPTPDFAYSSEKGFSFLHLTDMHVTRKRKGHVGYEACVNAVNTFNRSSDFVLMGGDLAFDGNYTAKEEFIDQIDLYKSISDTL